MSEWTDQKARIATAAEVAARWGGGFSCKLCGHSFAEGDQWRWVYAGGRQCCNFMVCANCDGPDVLDRYEASVKELQRLGQSGMRYLAISLRNAQAATVTERDSLLAERDSFANLIVAKGELLASAETRARSAEAERQKDQETIAELRDWMRSANLFAWAHERNCPRHDADAPCNCGLDAFLSRPRPFIESWKSTLRQVRLDVEKAPHAKTCPRFKEDFNCGRSAIETCKYVVAPCVKHRPITLPCNCFKSRVLADIDVAVSTVPENNS